MSSKFTFEQRIRQDILLMTVNDGFMTDVKILQDKYDLPLNPDDCQEYSEEPEFYNSKGYKKDIFNLQNKYIIPESHYPVLEYYVLHNNLNFKGSIFDNFWHLNPDAQTAGTENCVILKIYPDTTLKDIQEKWPQIKLFKDKLLNRQINKKVKIKNLERDLEIFKLKEQGKSLLDISKFINNDTKFNKVILGYEDIPKIIERLKEMSKRNMARKESWPAIY